MYDVCSLHHLVIRCCTVLNGPAYRSVRAVLRVSVLPDRTPEQLSRLIITQCGASLHRRPKTKLHMFWMIEATL